MSTFRIVYVFHVVFPVSLEIPMLKLLQESQMETNDLQKRINETIKLQQSKKVVYNKTQLV